MTAQLIQLQQTDMYLQISSINQLFQMCLKALCLCVYMHVHMHARTHVKVPIRRYVVKALNFLILKKVIVTQ